MIWDESGGTAASGPLPTACGAEGVPARAAQGRRDGPDGGRPRPLVYARWDDASCILVALNNTDGPATVDMELVRRRMRKDPELERWAGSRADLVFALADRVPASCTGSLLNLPAMGGAVLHTG